MLDSFQLRILEPIGVTLQLNRYTEP